MRISGAPKGHSAAFTASSALLRNVPAKARIAASSRMPYHTELLSIGPSRTPAEAAETAAAGTPSQPVHF